MATFCAIIFCVFACTGDNMKMHAASISCLWELKYFICTMPNNHKYIEIKSKRSPFCIPLVGINFREGNCSILIKISFNFIPEDSIDNKSAFVHPTGDKPLPEPMMTHFTPAYMVNKTLMIYEEEICYFQVILRGWVGLWGFLWWAPQAKKKDHQGVSSGWGSAWFHANSGLSSTQYE